MTGTHAWVMVTCSMSDELSTSLARAACFRLSKRASVVSPSSSLIDWYNVFSIFLLTTEALESGSTFVADAHSDSTSVSYDILTTFGVDW